MNPRHFLLPFILMIASSLVSAAPIYKWQDENGQVHFSDQPAENSKAEQTSLQTHASDGQKAFVDHPYSILKQVEFFQTQQQKQQTALLDKKLVQQALKTAEQLQSQPVLPSLDSAIPAIVSTPRYYLQTTPQLLPVSLSNLSGHGIHSGSSLSFTHQGSHHRFSLNLGGLNHLNYWNF